jgi:hypothetical protein
VQVSAVGLVVHIQSCGYVDNFSIILLRDL